MYNILLVDVNWLQCYMLTRSLTVGRFSLLLQVKNNGRLNSATNLCYWYGGYTDPPSAYSFITSSKLIKYEAGVKKGNDKLPKGIQKKLDEKKKLSANQEQLVRGLEEMNEDVKVAPEERVGRMPKVFLEVYELSSESEGEDEDEAPPAPQPKKKAPAKSKKKGKKAKDQQEEVDDTPVTKKA